VDSTNGTRHFHFDSITAEEAREVAGWRYEGELAVYNCPAEEVEGMVLVMMLSGNQYFAAHDAGTGEVIGHCCFGEDARVAGGDYSDESAVDVGLGLRPDLVGQGMGVAFVQAILGFARDRFGYERARLTVAAWNGRAIRTYEKTGFVQFSSFISGSGSEWVQMVRRVGRPLNE
jgi:[ribosomal protein S18]-alanine N-acetyltransferase